MKFRISLLLKTQTRSRLPGLKFHLCSLLPRGLIFGSQFSHLQNSYNRIYPQDYSKDVMSYLNEAQRKGCGTVIYVLANIIFTMS